MKSSICGSFLTSNLCFHILCLSSFHVHSMNFPISFAYEPTFLTKEKERKKGTKSLLVEHVSLRYLKGSFDLLDGARNEMVNCLNRLNSEFGSWKAIDQNLECNCEETCTTMATVKA